MYKTYSECTVSRKRARLVAKGFIQKYGIDFEDVFVLVAKYNTVGFMLAFSIQEDVDMVQLDEKAAFLDGELEEESNL